MRVAGGTAGRLRQARDTRSRILVASLRLFAREGYDRTAIRSIAREAGITDPTLYHHFRSKREIFRALLRPPAVGALEAPGTPGSAAAASAAVVAALMHWYTEPDLLRLVIAQCLDDDPDAVAFSRAMAGAFSARLESLLRAVCGEAAPLAARAISSCAAGVLIDAMIEHGAEFPAFAASAAFHESLDSIARLILDAWVEA